MPLVRRESNSSNCSTDSEKSVRFQDNQTVYFTHSNDEYDRKAVDEPLGLAARLGNISLDTIEEGLIQNPEVDYLVERNTFANSRRSAQCYAILYQIRNR